ncbi:MAG TPA: vanadium-dependent haloperoxidase [Actinophytocola sp.]|uniref:vanadium-dependent haloperoxidase n=1 Tax=Actinophytocola sp. TaxID=1872138 RepID=UPI002F93DFC1
MSIITVLAVICSLGAAPAAATHTSAGADAVRFWNEVTVSTVTGAAIPIPEQPLYLTYVHRAVYDGVLRANARHASSVAAATAAAHAVLVHYFPAQQATLDQRYADALAAVPDDRARRAGLAAGLAAAGKLLRERAGDGLNGPTKPAPPTGPGVWVPTPPNTMGVSSWLDGVRPFALRSAAQFRPGAPPSLNSRTWARAYDETRVLGSATSTARTAAQTETARFWSEPPYVQNQKTLRALTRDRGMSAARTAQLFALADSASADALIACWDAKYHYVFWRPFSAIPAGDTDGNPATRPDPAWTPLLATPNHPEYPSAHGCATSALFGVVAGLLGTHRIDVTLEAAVTGTSHHFATLEQLIREMGNARVWGGLHWRFSTETGVRLGEQVARVVLSDR